jgi:hypothetical protein
MNAISRATPSTLLREWTRMRSAVLLSSWCPGGAGSGADGKTPWSCREHRQTPRGQLAGWGENFHPAHWTQNNTKERNQVFVLFKGRTCYHYSIHKRKLEVVILLICAVGRVLWTSYTLPWLALWGFKKYIFYYYVYTSQKFLLKWFSTNIWKSL